MKTSTVLLVCILVTCSVWTVHGRTLEIKIDDHEQVDEEISVEAGKIPGLCWACKWALNKIKKVLGPNVTAEVVKAKLKSVCNEMGLLKSKCQKFVNGHLSLLIEELTTSDDVRTICVNAKACKSKEVLGLLFNSRDSDSFIEMDEYA
ncbi:hypothetical protein L3Q82_026505 [Scortum barcoo]|uniref:Uncharacterized protein n=1 Tax=Scortum barcoo TaxID=214431 RepID=A0ACB8WIT4_9TELE|nr:hypothetical protein L3Q82_026505 [Scortum barcoo]